MLVFYEAFYELYKIKQLLTHPNLKLCLVFPDVVEYRNLDGWSKDRKKGSSRNDRIPESLEDVVYINNANDYIKLIPDGIPKKFTTKEYKKAAGVNLHNSQIALNVLNHVGAVVKTGKQGNAFVYEKAQTLS